MRAIWLAAAATMLATSASARAQEPAIQSPEAALAQDAAEYARMLGTTPEEAARRLRAG